MGLLTKRSDYDTYLNMEKLIKSNSPRRLAAYFILSSKAEKNKNIYNRYSNLIRDAVNNKSLDVINFLLDKNLADASEGLKFASYRNNDALMDFFIGKGAKAYPDDYNMLNSVIGNEEKFYHLIELGAPVQNQACFFKIAAANDKNAYADILIQRGAKPEELPNAGQLLLTAIKSENNEFARTLLTRGVSADNATAFQALAGMGRPLDGYNLLLEFGAKPENLQYEDKNTLLHLVCTHMNSELFDPVMGLVHDGRIDINALNNSHENALHALITGRSDSEQLSDNAQKLVDAGIDINACDTKKRTPLHLAAAGGQLTIVQLLVRHDANLSLEDKEGHTPRSLAQTRNQTAVHDFLKESIGQKECWARIDEVSIARIAACTPAQKKITEIFNFESQERVTIIDDLSPERPSVALRHIFAEIKPQILQKAFDHYKKQDGSMNEAEALGGFDKNGHNNFLLNG